MFLVSSVAVHGLKLEIRNSGEMERVYELDVYRLVEALKEKFYLSQTQENTKQ